MKKRSVYGIIFIVAILLCFGLVDAYRDNLGHHFSKDKLQVIYGECVGMNKECHNFGDCHSKIVDEETREKMTKIHEAMENGDFEKVKEPKAELGLGFGHMKKEGNNFHGDCPFSK